MIKFLSRFFALVLVALFFASCSDEDEGVEYLYDREVTELNVLKGCADESDTSACYRLVYHLPLTMEDLEYIHVWVDTVVVDDTSKSVSSKQISKATMSIEIGEEDRRLYDTLDLTEIVKEYIEKGYYSLQVALFCEYSDDDNTGSVQRVILRFSDDLPPSRIPTPLFDSTWTNGALFEWYRPTDQTDFYKPMDLSGIIRGYNLVLYSADKDEDIRSLKIKLISPYGVDSVGSKYFRRHARIKVNYDSVYVDTVSHGDKEKNYLRFVVLDSNGFNTEVDSLNRYRLVINGLRSETEYTIGISAWDAVGNSSGNDGLSTVESNQKFYTTDSVAPIMPTKIYFFEDTLFPGMARLDSNNRLRIFWSQSVDPYRVDNPIESDSVVIIPDTCLFAVCYDTVSTYVIEYYNSNLKEWKAYDYAGGSGRYQTKYDWDGDTLAISARGTFDTDTIRWVSPGDTVILRIRSRDNSRYYSKALVDTIVVSPGALASELECPEGFVPVSVSDTSVFCMEKFEHRNDSGAFVNNVLHSEAKAICEGISASGFTVSLCNERDWELACLSGGSLPYGVLDEMSVDPSDYLFRNCNVGTNSADVAASIDLRDSRCVNPSGVRDLPGQYQEWVMGRSSDSAAVLKGSSYKIFNGLDRESLALCTSRAFPYYTRPAYTTDSVYLYREGTKVDTAYSADTSRTLYKVLSTNDFKDSLQFFDVLDSAGTVIGADYTLYSEYRKGGDAWLDTLANGLTYKPTKVLAVFLTGEKVAYRQASAFYKSPAIGFRCCAYPEN